MIEEEVEFRIGGGVVDAVLYRCSEKGRPAVVHLPDGIGLRPSQRQMARRVAEEGYTVLVPNIYYRTTRGPFFDGRPDFADDRVKARFGELTGPLTPEKMEQDGHAYVEFLAAQSSVSRGPMAVVGFCFTGAFALRTAAACGSKIAAAASFHGGGLWKDNPSSPHLVLPRVTARLYFGHARDDRSMPAESIAKLEQSLKAWGGVYESETYDALHGWTVPDSAAYNEREAERAFEKLRELLAATLG
jgi:carboxymethylenebutenolidase